MLNALIDTAKLVVGFLPWFLLLFLPTNGWDPLRRAVLICLVASVVFSINTLRKGFVLQWATVAFFLFCAISFYVFEWVSLAKYMGIVANGFLAGIIWFTVLIGNPFTLQYARAELPKEQWHDEGLIRSCRVIAVFWGVILLIPMVFGVFMLSHPSALPGRFYLFLSILCVVVGTGFTTIYKHVKRKQRTARQPA